MAKKSKLIDEIDIDIEKRLIYLKVNLKRKYHNRFVEILNRNTSKFDDISFEIGLDKDVVLIQFCFRLNDFEDFDISENFSDFLEEIKSSVSIVKKEFKDRDNKFKRVAGLIEKDVRKIFDLKQVKML